MSLCSIEFILFLFSAIVLYYIFPAKLRKYALLAVSLSFYFLCGIKGFVFLCIYIMVTYAISYALYMHKNTLLLILSIVISLSPLVFLKYISGMSYISDSIKYSLIIPLGISYFSLKVLGYYVEIWKDNRSFEKNIFTYALYVAFFAEVIVGPVDYSQNLIPQINSINIFDIDKFKNGFLLFLFGYFEKLVIADRIAIAVNSMYSNIDTFTGILGIIGICFYSFQIYIDFMGCTNIVRGVALMLGYDIPENFNQPYMADNISECWRRWHMSLTNWLRNYVYFPLGGSRKGTIRKYTNIMVVFVISGLWHGNSITFLVWGIINGIYQVIGNMTLKYRNAFLAKLGINRENKILIWIRRLGTFALMSIAWVFFRATSLVEAVSVLRNATTNITFRVLVDKSLMLFGLHAEDFIIMLLGIVIIVILDLVKEEHSISLKLVHESNVMYYLFTYILVLIIVVFGIYGSHFDVSSFIYAQF